MLRKLVLTATVIAAWCISAQALPFTLQTDTLEKQTFTSGLITFHNKVINTSAADLKLLVSRKNMQLPQGWSTMLCVGITCYPPTKDTITIQALGPGETLDVAVDVLPNTTQGSAQVGLNVEVAANPQEQAGATFTVWLGAKIAVLPGVMALRDPRITGLRAVECRQGSVTVDYEITDRATPVRLAVYSLQGKVIAHLTNANLAPGRYRQSWNLRNDAGELVGRGAYTVLLQAGKEMPQPGRITIQ
jgi:hypothetical protein